MSEQPYTPTEPYRRVQAFQTQTNTVHLLGSDSWGDNPACTSAFTHGQRVEVLLNEISCRRCQSQVEQA